MKGIYLATHFDNAYQTWEINDILRYIREMAADGADALGFWFDQHEYEARTLDQPGSLAALRLERLRRIAGEAHELGMQVVLLAMANESYADQVRPEIKADTSGRSGRSCYPTQLCVSGPEALAICQRNLADLVGRIPHIDTVCFWPYDQGGCDCARCAPWARTYVRVSRRLFDAIREARPAINPLLSVWDMNQEEVREVLDEAPRVWPEQPTIVINQDSRAVGHGLIALQASALPGGRDVRYVGFPEISMLFDTHFSVGTASWGLFGANPIPTHLAERYRGQYRQLDGFLAYSEGIYEDFNKWVLLQLAHEPSRALDSVVGAYGAKHLEMDDPEDFTAMVYAMERNWRHLAPPEDAVRVRCLMERVEARLSARTAASWRWRLFRCRAVLDDIVARARHAGRDGNAALHELDGVLAELRAFYRCTDYMHPPITGEQVRNGWIDPFR